MRAIGDRRQHLQARAVHPLQIVEREEQRPREPREADHELGGSLGEGGSMTAADGLAMPKSSEKAGATTDTTAASGPLAAVRRAAVAAARSWGGSRVSEAR